MKKTIVQINQLTKVYKIRSKSFFQKSQNTLTALDHVDLEIYENEVLGIVGESGSGKSTLGKSILQLIKPTSGEVKFLGQDLIPLKPKQLRPLRQQMQYIFQDPKSSLNPLKTIGWLLEEPLFVHKIGDAATRKKKVLEMLDLVGLGEEYVNRYARELSGGQAQRIAVLTSLILQPKFVVADEAVSALDVSIQAQVLNFMNELKKKMNLTMLFITHDLSVCHYMSDRIAVMYKGEIVELGESEELFSSPLHPYTKLLLSSLLSVEKVHQKEEIIVSEKETSQGCQFYNRCKIRTNSCLNQKIELCEVSNTRKVRCINCIGESYETRNH